MGYVGEQVLLMFPPLHSPSATAAVAASVSTAVSTGASHHQHPPRHPNRRALGPQGARSKPWRPSLRSSTSPRRAHRRRGAPVSRLGCTADPPPVTATLPLHIPLSCVSLA